MAEEVVLHLGDCLTVMAAMDADSVDAVVTDPPYGLGFMGKKWDAMPPGDEVASTMLRVLKPAHYLIAFGGTRTHHRLMVALEDTGFEIRDCLMWLYGSGFPKGKAQLKPAYEPIILCRKPGQGVTPLGIDECRIEGPMDGTWGATQKSSIGYGGTDITEYRTRMPSGRWPANIVLDEETASEAGAWSRYFYTAKASRSERNAGCERLEAKAAEWDHWVASGTNPGGISAPRMNHHPTVKPVALMRWLVRLVAQPGGIVFDPFMGSGTTGVAAVQEGRLFVGIELEPEYYRIAQARIAHAQERQLALAVDEPID